MKLKLIRNVTKEECSWLDKTFEKDDEVFQYYGCTYGCISNYGVACSIEKDKEPFFELPLNSVLALRDKNNRVIDDRKP